MDYSKAFRIIRAAFGLSQADFSKLLGIGPSYMSLIESGKRQPGGKVVDSLAEVLRIPKPLIILLASGPEDLVSDNDQEIQELTRSLLRLLVSASGEQVQPSLPFGKLEKEDEGK